MGSDAFRSLFTLYQSKTKVSDQVQMLEQLKRRLSESADNGTSFDGTAEPAANPQV